MKRYLLWTIAGCGAVGLAVPAVAAVQADGTSEDDGVPGDVRGNCDEPEHAGDPGCSDSAITVTVPSAPATPGSPSTIVVTTGAPSVSAPRSQAAAAATTSTVADTLPSNSVTSTSLPGGPDVTLPTTNPTTSLPGDISGPCDEAEHAGDPRCTGAGGSGDADDRSGGGDDSGPDVTLPTTNPTTSLPGDISGPCDEAEHADDPRCTGSGTDDDDNSGPGNGDDGGDDNSGPGSGDDNSGPGSDDDNSGPGSGGDDDDDDDDDSSGSGSDDDGGDDDGGDDDSSGHGGGDDD